MYNNNGLPMGRKKRENVENNEGALVFAHGMQGGLFIPGME